MGLFDLFNKKKKKVKVRCYLCGEVFEIDNDNYEAYYSWDYTCKKCEAFMELNKIEERKNFRISRDIFLQKKGIKL